MRATLPQPERQDCEGFSDAVSTDGMMPECNESRIFSSRHSERAATESHQEKVRFPCWRMRKPSSWSFFRNLFLTFARYLRYFGDWAIRRLNEHPEKWTAFQGNTFEERTGDSESAPRDCGSIARRFVFDSNGSDGKQREPDFDHF